MRVFVLAVVVLVAAGCVSPGDPVGPPSAPVDPTPPEPPGPFEEPSFDGMRAHALVESQVHHPDGTVRYRIPGTDGNREVANWIADQLVDLEFAVSWHHFNATYGCEETWMHNVIGERAGTTGKTIVFAAHYDTRPIADHDPDPQRRAEPIHGANDGASGVAVLLELARVLPETDDAVRFVFFDAEDGGGHLNTPFQRCTEWIIGSTHYAGSLTGEELAAIRAFVLVDMVGDHDLVLPWEQRSRENPGGRELQERIWGVAHALGHDAFVPRLGHSILDDHVPFVERGVAAIDIIHHYPDRGSRIFPDTWHTHDDTVDNVSPDSLAAVGRTLETWLRQAAPATE